MKLALAARFFCRKVNPFNQPIPTFKGFKLWCKQKPEQTVSRAIGTYLLSINSKVTQYQTVDFLQYYLPRLAERVNMPLVNITVEVGAAINAYFVTWYDPIRFDDVVIHLESFHSLKENFKVKK